LENSVFEQEDMEGENYEYGRVYYYIGDFLGFNIDY